MRLIYMVAADVLRALGWEVEINEKENYWNLVLTNTNSSEDMPESHKSCIRGLLRGWLMEFNYEGGRQQVNIYKDLHGLNPEDDRYSCLDTCVKRTDSNIPVYKLDDREIFVRRKDRFDRYVLAEPIDDPLTTRLTCGSKFNPDNKPEPEPEVKTVSQEEYFREVSTLNGKIRQLEQQCADERQKTDREKTKVEKMLHKSVGCLDAVKAMLESSGGGATHRMRDFYAEAMVKFIGNAKATLQSYAEPEPF